MAVIAHDPDKKPDGRTTLELGAVLPQTATVNEAGNLCVGGVDLVELARQAGTAVYVMDEEHIRTQLRSYRKAFEGNGITGNVVYAGKAFITRAMVQLVNKENACLDVSSGGELYLALAAGFPAARIIEHGNNKTEEELIEAVYAGIGRIAVDSFEELEMLDAIANDRGINQAILLRINPGVLADTHAFVATGAEDSKFGFSLQSGAALHAVLRAQELPNLDLKGLHVHIGSQILSADPFDYTIKVICEFMAQLQDQFSIQFEEFNLGGGLGVAYLAGDEPPSIEEFMSRIAASLKEHCAARNLTVPYLFLEPGRSVVANAGVTLYTVGSVKDLPGIRTYVSVNGGMTDNIRTALYDARYEAVIANKASLPRDRIVTLAGKHCESGDVVAIDTAIQTPEAGDIVCVFATGAYCYTMSSNYNKQTRPAVYFVRDGSERLVVRRETYADLLKCDIV